MSRKARIDAPEALHHIIVRGIEQGEKGKIVKIRGAGAMHRYLFEMGLVVGRIIFIEKKDLTPQGDPIEVRVDSSVLELEKEMAANIHVEVAK